MNTPQIIDAEVHLLPPEWCMPGKEPPHSERVLWAKIYSHPDRDKALYQASVDGLLSEMERSGIDGALIMGLPWADPQRNDMNNNYIRKVCEESEGKFLGLGVLSDPKTSVAADEVRRIDEVHGLRGCKVIPSWQGWKLDDPEFETSLSEMEKRGLLLFPHIDHPYLQPEGHDTPSALLEIARRHPELRIIAPHLGGSLCFYALHHAIGKLLKNILFAASVPTTMKMIEWAVDAVGADRVAFATDFPFNPSHDQKSLIEEFDNLELSNTQREWILGQSLREFIGWTA